MVNSTIANVTANKLIPWMSNWGITNRYAQAGIIIGIFLVAALIATFVAQVWLHKLAKKTKNKWDDMIVERIRPPFSFVMFFIGLKIAFNPLNFTNKYVVGLVDAVVTLSATFFIVVFVDVILQAWGEKIAKKTKSDLDEELIPLFRKFARVVIWIIGFIIVLGQVGVNIGPLIASLGIAGVVLGFALKDSLGNIFGGVSLIADRAVKRGDRIKLESGEVVEVKDVGLRSTKMRTFDNELLIVPNGWLANSKIQNFTQPSLNQRVMINFGVEYGTNVKKVHGTVLPVIKKAKNALKDPAPSVDFIEMGDSALVFRAVVWVDDFTKAFETKTDMNEKVYNALNKAKIGIPFPTQTVYVKK